LPYIGTEIMRIDDPKRGDIITFIPREETEKNYVKRVIGLPGDRIRIRYLGVCDPEFPVERSDNPEYSCSTEFQDSAYQAPDLAYVEYKPNDEGEWQHFTYRELSAEESRAILTDADSSSVLHPEVVPGYQSDVPVVFEETIEGKKHLIVERFRGVALDHGSICPTFKTTGCVLGEDKYFVMGDNRDDSKDSRFHEVGTIDRGSIQGKALIIYFSIDWRDQICYDYSMGSNNAEFGVDGFRLENFPVEDQVEYCSNMDQYMLHENLWQYLMRTALYRVPRMDVRWSRLGNLLH
jgi:signal peptidase I